MVAWSMHPPHPPMQRLTQEQPELFLAGLPGATSLLDGWMDETRISTVEEPPSMGTTFF